MAAGDSGPETRGKRDPASNVPEICIWQILQQERRIAFHPLSLFSSISLLDSGRPFSPPASRFLFSSPSPLPVLPSSHSLLFFFASRASILVHSLSHSLPSAIVHTHLSGEAFPSLSLYASRRPPRRRSSRGRRLMACLSVAQSLSCRRSFFAHRSLRRLAEEDAIPVSPSLCLLSDRGWPSSLCVWR